MIKVSAIWKPSIQQQNYRSVLEAMSRPGSLQSIITDGHNENFTAVLATLMDASVTLADPHELLSDSSWPLLQAKQCNADAADFILVNGSCTPNFEPKLGTLESPESSATILVQSALDESNIIPLKLSGPGINGVKLLNLSGIHEDWLTRRQEWVCEFPLGVDLLILNETGILGIPRTSKVEVC